MLGLAVVAAARTLLQRVQGRVGVDEIKGGSGWEMQLQVVVAASGFLVAAGSSGRAVCSSSKRSRAWL